MEKSRERRRVKKYLLMTLRLRRWLSLSLPVFSYCLSFCNRAREAEEACPPRPPIPVASQPGAG